MAVFFIFFLIKTSFASDYCLDWFKSKNIKQDKYCSSNCMDANVNMGNFECRIRCNEFCSEKITEKLIFKISELYPGLTEEEKILISKEPKKMYKAYKLSWEAESICTERYPVSIRNDISDACRHFIWSGLLNKDLGLDFSTKVLNAHENDPDQPESEKAMDLANNRLGQIVATQLIKNGTLSNEQLLESFKENLSKNRLIILNKTAGK